MSELNKLRIVAEYELLKHLRRMRLYVVIGLAIVVQLLILIGLPVLGEGYPEKVGDMAVLLSMGPSFAIIGAIFFAGDAISGEFEGETGYTLFPNPVKRITIVTGKYFACFLAMALVTAVAYSIVSICLFGIYSEVPIEVGKSFALCLLVIASVIAMTFFFSSISKGAIGGTVTTIIVMFVVFGILEGVLTLTGQSRWFLLSYAGDVVITVYNGYGPFGGMMEQMPAMEPPEVGTSVAVLLVYLIVFFLISIVITNRREMV